LGIEGVKLRCGLASVLYEAERLRVKWRASTFCGIAVEYRVQRWVVVHLELAVELETASVMEYVLPQLRETCSEVVALLVQHRQTIAVALPVLRGGAVQLLRGMEDPECEDGKAVDNQAGGFGVQRGRLQLWSRETIQQGPIDLLHEVVAELVQAVYRALGGGQRSVRGGGIAGLVLAVPEVEVGAVLVEDELIEC